MRPKRTCSAPDCDRPFYCRDFCTQHYQRWRRTGTLDLPTVAARFWPRTVARENGCVEWTGHADSRGYGHTSFEGKFILAHRLAWTLKRGPIPDGLVIDHLCRNPRCVNVDHLRVVTQKVNMLSGTNPPARNAVKTHCLRGHEFTVENTWIDRHGYRFCRACAVVRRLARKARQ